MAGGQKRRKGLPAKKAHSYKPHIYDAEAYLKTVCVRQRSRLVPHLAYKPPLADDEIRSYAVYFYYAAKKDPKNPLHTMQAPPAKPLPAELFDPAKPLPRDTVIGFTIGYLALDYDTKDARKALGTKTMEEDPAFDDVVRTGNRNYKHKTTLHDNVAMNGMNSLPLINIPSNRLFRVVCSVINENGRTPRKMVYFLLANPDSAGICEAYRSDGMNKETIFFLPQFRNDRHTSRLERLGEMRKKCGAERDRLRALLPEGLHITSESDDDSDSDYDSDDEKSTAQPKLAPVVAGLNTKGMPREANTNRPVTSQPGSGSKISKLGLLPINPSHLPSPPRPLGISVKPPPNLFNNEEKQDQQAPLIQELLKEAPPLQSIEEVDIKDQLRIRSETLDGRHLTSASASVMSIPALNNQQAAAQPPTLGRDMGLYLLLREDADGKLDRGRVLYAWKEFMAEHPDLGELINEPTPDEIYDMIVTFEEEKCISEYRHLRSTIFTYAKRRQQIAPGTTFDPAALARESAEHIKKMMGCRGDHHLRGAVERLREVAE
ncbi:hypothetical protein B0T11DRAFT_98750 [Plectosphaerella cucumerina]|uniref:Uncharacterized protein n=1 Tax=Plectosphaerella cucumerina TaxID=40658 RepID=A0A8K0X197_9PEZI|nr:hypothetical protein B0T11DRAFT_98750 [Plectosphaerella cucumerina]